jgi:RsiW-degrading membrane proteinase PrsW (M82 family)
MILALLPTFIIGYYIYNKDTEKEPLNYVLKLFLFGYISCLISALIELGIDKFVDVPTNILDKVLYYFLAIAFVEELVKYIFLIVSSYNNKEYDQVYDAIVYAVFIALGFATVENVLYLFANSNNESVMTIGALRAILSVPTHACMGVIMGYYMTLAKIEKNKQKEKSYLILAFTIPFLSHGLFDTLLACGEYYMMALFVIVLGIVYIFSLSKIDELSGNNKKIKKIKKS